MNRYFKRHWDETTGKPSTDSWGTSDYYFETDASFVVLRQIQLFENGKALKYDTVKPEDQFGSISDQPLDEIEFAEFAISEQTFETIWNSIIETPPKKWWKFWQCANWAKVS